MGYWPFSTLGQCVIFDSGFLRCNFQVVMVQAYTRRVVLSRLKHHIIHTMNGRCQVDWIGDKFTISSWPRAKEKYAIDNIG